MIDPFYHRVFATAKTICESLHGGDMYWEITRDQEKYWLLAFKITCSFERGYDQADWKTYPDYCAMIEGETE